VPPSTTVSATIPSCAGIAARLRRRVADDDDRRRLAWFGCVSAWSGAGHLAASCEVVGRFISAPSLRFQRQGTARRRLATSDALRRLRSKRFVVPAGRSPRASPRGGRPIFISVRDS
jgi:hypothetical protein